MDYIVTTSVFVTAHVLGFHRWPDAPDEVDYLRDRHRHNFGIRVELGVDHSDRAIEYHMLKGHLLTAMLSFFPAWSEDGISAEFGTWSCEQIAESILDWLRTGPMYAGLGIYRVTVDEDGENGSTILAVR